MRRMLPQFASISQFEPGLPAGMCGLIGTLGGLQYKLSQGLTEGTYPLNAAGIKNLFDFERARGLCASNGAQNIYSLGEACRALLPALASRIEVVGYDTFNLATFHNVLKYQSGVNGIIAEYANGQALTGDETGLHYHFNAIGGIDTEIADEGLIGGYATCDGDARTDLPANQATPPIWHTWPTLVRAQPIAYVVCNA